MRIGVFSGTFDPVHNGHIGFAEEAREQLGLDIVVFMPEKSPRRKQYVKPIEKRTEMLEIALADKQWASVHHAETDNHTVEETMEELRQEYDKSDQFYLLMGVDVYEHLHEWPNCGYLLETTKIILGLRTEDDGELALELADDIGDKPTMIVSSNPGLSSSDVRDGSHDGVPRAVADYIEENELYV